MADPIIFDQYSRYKVCADIIEKLSQPNETILDVGSGVECVLGKMLPNLKITYLDPLFSNISNKSANTIAGDIFTSELTVKKFDHVVSVDTLEHIDAKSRPSFIKILCDLANKDVVIACPCSDAGDAIETDKWIGEVYSASFKKDYHWLHEHKEYGLPLLSEILAALKDLKWYTQVTQNGHTPWLRSLLSFTLSALELNENKPLAFELSKYFNENLYEADHLEPSYRQVILATKEPPTISIKRDGVDPELRKQVYVKWENIQKKIAETITTYIVKFIQKEKELADLQHLKEKELANKESQLSDLKSSLTDKESQLSNLKSSINRQRISTLQPQIIINRQRISTLQPQIIINRQRISTLQPQIITH